MKIVFLLVTIMGLVSSCGSLQSNMRGDCNEITEIELNILSRNCEYVENLINKGVKLDSKNRYLYDLRIVNVWKYTDCFTEYTFSQFVKDLDKPDKTIYGIDKQIHHYFFYTKDESYSQCTLEVKNDSIFKNYCVDNITIKKIGMN